MMTTACNNCHQGPEHALLLVYPVHYPKQVMTAYFKSCRAIEDMMLKNSMEFSSEVSMHFIPPEEPTPDQRADKDGRCQFAKARLSVSSKMGADSLWLETDVLAKFGGRMDGIPLSRQRDLPGRSHSEVGPIEPRLTPQERASQRGPAAFAHIIEKFMEGLNLTRADKLLILDYNTQAGEKLEACWTLQKKHNVSEIPFVSYITLFVVENINAGSMDATHLINRSQALLMSEYWENAPEAGPSCPTKKPEDFVGKPELNLFAWSGGRAVLPDIVKNMFPDGDFHEKWGMVVDAMTAELSALSSGVDSRPTEPTTDSLLSGPDMNHDPTPVDLEKMLNLEAVSAVEFPTADVSLG